jgi:hypothetical protein
MSRLVMGDLSCGENQQRATSFKVLERSLRGTVVLFIGGVVTVKRLDR